MNTVDQALLAYSRQEISNTAVVRAMAESAEWYVPMLFAADQLGITVADHAIILGTEFGGNPKFLTLFTDQAAVHRAQGQPLGAFSGKLRGVDIFDALSEAQFDRVDVNPGSPRELTFYMDRDSFGLVKLVSQVVRLEQALASATDATIPWLALRDHPGYMIAITPSNQPATTELKGFDGPCSMVFTSPDRFELYKSRLSEEQCAAISTVTLPGASLFTQLQNFEVAGIILNPSCPGATVLPAFLFPRIVSGE